MDTRRAQQFMPFAALKGYYDLIEKKENEYQCKKEMSDTQANDLNYKFSQVKIGAEIFVKYYDVNQYRIIKGILKYIDVTKGYIFLDSKRIFLTDIYDIWGDSILSR